MTNERQKQIPFGNDKQKNGQRQGRAHAARSVGVLQRMGQPPRFTLSQVPKGEAPGAPSLNELIHSRDLGHLPKRLSDGQKRQKGQKQIPYGDDKQKNRQGQRRGF
jgi:hypothetical protein